MALFGEVSSRAAVLVDFGASSGTGANTVSPDVNGNHWNNVNDHLASGPVYGLIDDTGAASGISLDITQKFDGSNGIGAGGLLTPNAALLGDFAIATATEDYFYFGSTVLPQITLSGLLSGYYYTFSFFGSRSFNDIFRQTTYKVTGGNGVFTTVLQTSGSGSGTLANPYGNDDDIAIISGITANGSGQAVIDLSSAQIGYLGIMSIEAHRMVPEPGTVTLLFFGGVVLWRARRHNLKLRVA